MNSPCSFGGRGSSTLTGEDLAGLSTWTLGAAPTYGDGGNSLGFVGFTALQGGSGPNTFNVNGGIATDLYGGAADDTFAFGPGEDQGGVLGVEELADGAEEALRSLVVEGDIRE